MIEDLKQLCLGGDYTERWSRCLSICNSFGLEPDVDAYAIFEDKEILMYGHNLHIRVCENPKICFIAHHDCVPNSDGANDNGAAVIELIYLAVRAKRDNIPIEVILVDHEEFLAGFGPVDQMGSMKVARDMKAGNIPLVLVLDVCGSGDIMHVSRSSRHMLVPWVLDNLDAEIISTPPSDHISFLMNEIGAILLGTLPREEIDGIRRDTWSRLHSPEDNIDSVSEDTMNMVVDKLYNLSRDYHEITKERKTNEPRS